MNYSLISFRYAKALFSLASDKKAIDAVKNDMQTIILTGQEVQSFADFLGNPTLKPSLKESTLEKLFAKEFHESTLALVKLLVKNKREAYLIDIARRYIDFYKEAKGIKSVNLISVKPLPEKLKKSVVELVKKAFKCEVDLTEKQDEKILGGFVLRVQDLQYDASVANRLKTMRKDLLNTQVD